MIENELRKEADSLRAVKAKKESISSSIKEQQQSISELEESVRSLLRMGGAPGPESVNGRIASHQQGQISADEEDAGAQSLREQIAFCEMNALSVLDDRIASEFRANPPPIPRWEALDYVVVGVAGIVGALVDILLVRIPKTMKVCGVPRSGSPITELMRDKLAVNEDNPLARWAKVSFDNIDRAGLNPRDHRLDSWGHDPVLGLVFGVLDMWRGGLTGVGKDGIPIVLSGLETDLSSPLVAPVVWFAHVLSDVGTKMGIPIPGWGLTQLLQFGSFGTNGHTVAEMTRYMYRSGYDLRHLLTMGLSVFAVEFIIRTYLWLSRAQGPEQSNPLLDGSVGEVVTRRAQDAKLNSLLFWSHSVATAGNAGKIALYGGNVLAINVAQWARFLTAFTKYVKCRFRDISVEKIRANRTRIEGTWKGIEAIKLDGLSSMRSVLVEDMPLLELHFGREND